MQCRREVQRWQSRELASWNYKENETRTWGSTQQMFVRGGSASRSKPLPFYIPFFTKRVPLSYTF